MTSPSHPSTGRVILVGAGPGDPRLLTLAAVDALAAADVVFVDRLVNPVVLEHAQQAEIIQVGKTPYHPGGHSVTQHDINERIVEAAGEGKTVARLKGGDPFLFGRGGEEALACQSAGIPVAIIPGISSALVVPASVGIPVTHRGVAQAVTIVTGHSADADPDWQALARSAETLVILMGVKRSAEIAQTLLTEGLSPSTPICAISQGTHATQTVVNGDLQQMADSLVSNRVSAPAIIVVGDVSRLTLATLETPAKEFPHD